MKNIHVLPTDRPTWLHKSLLSGILRKSSSCISDMKQAQGMNIYITSDEEIKEGDWVIDNDYDKPLVYKADRLFFEIGKEAKKIILTTDQDLIEDGVQAINDEFLEWFVKNPSCEEVDIESKVKKDGVWTDSKGYVELPTTHSISYKIIIPKEELKQETLQKSLDSTKQFIKNKSDSELNDLMVEFDDYEFEESTFTSIENELIKEAKKVWEESHPNPIEMALFGAKWQQERSYSDEDLRIAFVEGHNSARLRGSYKFNGTFEEDWILWFEQFKKK